MPSRHSVQPLKRKIMSFQVGMSCIASMGLLFHLGIAYNDLISFVSVLAMAIGVDNSFVILDGWKRHLHIKDQVMPTNYIGTEMIRSPPTSTSTINSWLVAATADN